MTVGDKTFKGLAVPLSGESEIKQVTLGTDILTITGVGSQSGDFLVLRNSALTETVVVEVSGNTTIAGTLTAVGALSVGGSRIAGMTPLPTAPTTGLTEGQLFLAMNASTPQIGICYSTAANSIRYITAESKSFGRTTA